MHSFDYPDNACVRYDRRTRTEKAVQGMERIFDRCRDLNPSDNTRPVRDGAFIRTHYKQLKSVISECFGRYTNTGQQDGSEDDKYDTWCEFAAPFPDVVCYSYALMSFETLNQFGKLMPLAVARQTGILGQKRVRVSANNTSSSTNTNTSMRTAIRSPTSNNGSNEDEDSEDERSDGDHSKQRDGEEDDDDLYSSPSAKRQPSQTKSAVAKRNYRKGLKVKSTKGECALVVTVLCLFFHIFVVLCQAITTSHQLTIMLTTLRQVAAIAAESQRHSQRTREHWTSTRCCRVIDS